ncbi:calnexin-like protein [Lates japonicus]|uniref:Calnexin-like protein n=1 Tax=Lates japonicus TaxID=270547 RepID=A0AAD3RD37_LATJO|nr:calnexin-like protein [Lates japonicus]
MKESVCFTTRVWRRQRSQQRSGDGVMLLDSQDRYLIVKQLSTTTIRKQQQHRTFTRGRSSRDRTVFILRTAVIYRLKPIIVDTSDPIVNACLDQNSRKRQTGTYLPGSYFVVAESLKTDHLNKATFTAEAGAKCVRQPPHAASTRPSTKTCREPKTMDQRVGLFILLVAGLLCLSLAPISRADDLVEDGLDDDVDVEDELDLGLAGAEEEEEELEGDAQDEAPPAPKTPPTPKVTYKAPEPMGEHFFAESFDRGTLDGWVLSKAKKDDADEEIAKYDGKWAVEEMKDSKLPGDKGLVLKSRAKHHAISAQLLRPFTFDTKPLIIQYEVNFQSGIDCGGAYVKLLTQTPELNLDEFVDKTPYTIMFGPDKCGEDYKLHFIFRHKNPKTGEYEEKHAKKPDADLRTYYTDKKTHLYTLVGRQDDTRVWSAVDVVPPVDHD